MYIFQKNVRYNSWDKELLKRYSKGRDIDEEVLHIHKGFNRDAGGWIQFRCSKGKIKSMPNTRKWLLSTSILMLVQVKT